MRILLLFIRLYLPYSSMKNQLFFGKLQEVKEMTLPLVFSEIYLLIVTTILVLWNNADVLLKNSVSLSIIYRTTSCSTTDPNLSIVQNHVAASWWGMWDKALDLGTKGTRLSQCLFSLLCPTVFSDGVCPLCESQILSHHNYFERLNTVHMNNKNVLNFSNTSIRG